MTNLTADDALRLTAELNDWLLTPDAARIQVNSWERGNFREEVTGPPLEVSAHVNAGLSHRLQGTMPFGHMPAYEQAVGVVRAGGVISRVGVPQYDDAAVGFASLFGRNIRLAGGPAPVRAYIDELMPYILDGTINPGRVFDATTDLDGVPAGYRDMDERKSLKVLIKP